MNNLQVSVLLVDDQKIIHMAIRKMLAEAPEIALHSCYDGREAVAAALQLRPTVILQDITMPGISGMDILPAYRQHLSIAEVPVLMLSATTDVEIKADAFRLGADDYLVKMPHPVELIARLKHHTRAYIDHLERAMALLALEEEHKKLETSNRELEAANQELDRLASQDGLTSIANRRYFDQHLKKEWLRAMRRTDSVSLMMIDVDCFKLYNDSFGHVAGDECLKLIAAALSAQLNRPGDLVARYGGEEFVVLLPHTEAQGAALLAEQMRKAVIELQLPHTESLGADVVSISIGFATLVAREASQEKQLIQVADEALYTAKEQGRNRVFSRTGSYS